MKHILWDASQILIALLLTTSVASAMKSPTKPHIVQNRVLVAKAVKIAPSPQKAATAAPVAPAASQPAPSQPAPAVQAPSVVPTTHEGMMAAAGIAPSDYGAVDYIVSRESGWCATKWEGEIGYCPAFHGVSDYDGYGLCQSTPPQKMALAGADWETNPVTQLKWCSTHAAEYGGWWAAYDHWIAHHNW